MAATIDDKIIPSMLAVNRLVISMAVKQHIATTAFIVFSSISSSASYSPNVFSGRVYKRKALEKRFGGVGERGHRTGHSLCAKTLRRIFGAEIRS